MTLVVDIKEKLIEFVPNSFRIQSEGEWYRNYIFKADNYIIHKYSNENDGVTYLRKGRCHIFSMGTQDNMIADGWLQETFSNEYRDETILNDWLKKNISGFYATRGWGNGRANYGQSHYGLWHVEVYLMRKEDAMAFKLQWL